MPEPGRLSLARNFGGGMKHVVNKFVICSQYDNDNFVISLVSGLGRTGEIRMHYYRAKPKPDAND